MVKKYLSIKLDAEIPSLVTQGGDWGHVVRLDHNFLFFFKKLN
jgi:hypothetical protein